MLDFFKEYSFIIGAMSGGLAAYLLSLLINYLTRERKNLGYAITSDRIVEQGHKDLEIRYRGVLIERLYSHRITLRNVGNRALKDVPIHISFDYGRFVDFELKTPDGAKFIVTPENNDQTLVVECDLLNRGESFDVGLTTVDKNFGNIKVAARAENLQCKKMDYDMLFAQPSDLVKRLAKKSMDAVSEFPRIMLEAMMKEYKR